MVGEAEMQKGPVPQPRVVVENWKGYLGCRGPPGGTRDPSPTPASPAQDSRSKKKILHNFWL